MPADQRKRKAKSTLPGRRSKAQRRPELPRALVKELGCAVARPRNVKACHCSSVQQSKQCLPRKLPNPLWLVQLKRVRVVGIRDVLVPNAHAGQ